MAAPWYPPMNSRRPQGAEA